MTFLITNKHEPNHSFDPILHYKYLLQENFTGMTGPYILPRQSTNNTMQTRRSTNINYGPYILLFNWGQKACPLLQKKVYLCCNLFRKIAIDYSSTIYNNSSYNLLFQCWQIFLLDCRFQFKLPTYS